MTILTYWHDDERALVASDTHGSLVIDGRATKASKIFYLPHSQLVVAGRGLLIFMRSFYDGLHHMNADYDSALELAPNALQWATEMTANYLRENSAYGQADQSTQQLAVIGWSAKAQAMRCTVFARDSMEAGFQHAQQPWMLGPWEMAWGDPPAPPKDLASLGRIASLQSRRAAAAGLEGLGSEFALCELTRHSFHCELKSAAALERSE